MGRRIRKTGLMMLEAARSFSANEGMTYASSLAFYCLLALIPALFLLTYINSVAAGLHTVFTIKAKTVLAELLPAYSARLVDEIMLYAKPSRALGAINALVLLWSITPFMTSMRQAFDAIFHVKAKKRYLMQKLFDIALIALFTFTLSAIAAGGVLLKVLPSVYFPAPLETLLPFIALWIMVLVLYSAFSPPTKLRHLMAGALVATLIWFALRPAFNVFLVYNTGFGIAFGSLKSIFVVALWIYISQCVLLYGAEFTASLRRGEAVMVKRLMDGKRLHSELAESALVHNAKAGDVLFIEGSGARDMYYVKSGTIEVSRGGRNFAIIGPGSFVGEMSFLLNSTRTATATVVEDAQLVRVSHESFAALNHQYPGITEDMLKDMARRLKNTTDGAYGPLPD